MSCMVELSSKRTRCGKFGGGTGTVASLVGGGRTTPGDTIYWSDTLMKVYFFAAEFTKNSGETISWKAERV